MVFYQHIFKVNNSENDQSKKGNLCYSINGMPGGRS